MRILFAGTPAAAVPTLQRLHAAGHQIVGVITAPAAPAGRGRKLTASPVSVVANELGIPVFEFTDINSPEARAEILELNPTAVAVVAYGQLLKPSTLELVPQGWINLHFSLLPAYRGAAPVQRAILAGEEVTGASTFWIEAGLDDGPVFGQLTLEIAPSETAGELLERLAAAGADLMAVTFDSLESGNLRPSPQPLSDISYAPKVSVEEAEIDWSHPALAIERKIRAFNPSPFAWTVFEGQKILLGKAEIADTDIELAAGSIFVQKNQVLVGTGSTSLSLLEVKPAGKGWMKAADWARGVRSENWQFHG